MRGSIHTVRTKDWPLVKVEEMYHVIALANRAKRVHWADLIVRGDDYQDRLDIACYASCCGKLVRIDRMTWIRQFGGLSCARTAPRWPRREDAS